MRLGGKCRTGLAGQKDDPDEGKQCAQICKHDFSLLAWVLATDCSAMVQITTPELLPPAPTTLIRISILASMTCAARGTLLPLLYLPLIA
jgi:hypothetical protein